MTHAAPAKTSLVDLRIDRQNILNNSFALQEIEKAAGITGILYEGKVILLKEQVASFLEIDVRTVENYLQHHSEELHANGYVVLRGEALVSLKKAIFDMHVPEIYFGNIKKSPQLGIFDFRAFLNLVMLVVESDHARLLRRMILDIVIDTINFRAGGGTKYINQRDEDFLHSAFHGEHYRKEFTHALKEYVAGGNFKYANYTNKIYVSIFKERAQEYSKILRLAVKDKLRDTMYAEVLDLIASYECGFAALLKDEFQKKQRPLSNAEVDNLFKDFESQPHWKPLIEKAWRKMASRDLAFRDALYLQLEEYVAPLDREEFERFLGEKSMELAERLRETSREDILTACMIWSRTGS
ncbi:MAG TPA: DNA-binding protein [Synergistaceae bacterium]|nr:DNA-binding protein [Synergistaceae bacterium]